MWIEKQMSGHVQKSALLHLESRILSILSREAIFRLFRSLRDWLDNVYRKQILMQIAVFCCERTCEYVISVTCLSGLLNADDIVQWADQDTVCRELVTAALVRPSLRWLTLHTLTAVSSYFLPLGHLFLSLSPALVKSTSWYIRKRTKNVIREELCDFCFFSHWDTPLWNESDK